MVLSGNFCYTILMHTNKYSAYGRLAPSVLSWCVPLCVFIIGTFASIGIMRVVETDEHLQLKNRYDEQVLTMTDAIRARMLGYEQVLRGGQALFAASQSVERNEWHAYYESLKLPERLPGIQGFGFSRYIHSPEVLEDIILRAKEDGYTDFAVRPDPSNRSEVHVIEYIEPMDERNALAFGYDMSSEQTRNAAMQEARDSGNPVLSGKVTLKQEGEDGEQAGTLLYVPVYKNGTTPTNAIERRQALVGFVYAAFRMNDLLESISAEANTDLINIHIYDDNTQDDDALLFTNSSNKMNNPLFEHMATISIANRTWLLAFHSNKNFAGSGTGTPLHLYVLIGSMMITGLLTLLTYSAFRIRKQAIDIAHSMTTSLQEKENRLRSIYNIASGTSLSFDEQMKEILRVGLTELNMEMGIISRIEHDTYTVVHVAPDEKASLQGEQFPLGKTYCSMTVVSDDIVTIDNMSSDEHKGHPCYEHFGVESYIGIALMVNGKTYGTVNFTSTTKQKRSFNNDEQDFVRLIAKWIATAIERHTSISELEKQKDELQRINDSMVGRELKMIELKKELDSYRNHESDTKL